MLSDVCCLAVERRASSVERRASSVERTIHQPRVVVSVKKVFLLRIEVRLEKIQDENDDDDVTLAGDVYADYEYWYDFHTT